MRLDIAGIHQRSKHMTADSPTRPRTNWRVFDEKRDSMNDQKPLDSEAESGGFYTPRPIVNEIGQTHPDE
jgi:hypothetical protein